MSNNKDEKEIARQYIEDHKINKLFKRILILLLINRPQNVKRFIVEQLQNERDLSAECLLNDDEMETLFKMLEHPMIEKGVVFGKKVNGSLMAMGIAETVNDKKFNLQQFKETLNEILKNY